MSENLTHKENIRTIAMQLAVEMAKISVSATPGYPQPSIFEVAERVEQWLYQANDIDPQILVKEKDKNIHIGPTIKVPWSKKRIFGVL